MHLVAGKVEDSAGLSHFYCNKGNYQLFRQKFKPTQSGDMVYVASAGGACTYYIYDVSLYKVTDPAVVSSTPADGSKVTPSNKMSVTYNNDMDDSTALNASNYVLSGGSQTVQSVVKQMDTSYLLTFNDVLSDNTSYSLDISNLKDKLGQSMGNTSIAFSTPVEAVYENKINSASDVGWLRMMSTSGTMNLNSDYFHSAPYSNYVDAVSNGSDIYMRTTNDGGASAAFVPLNIGETYTLSFWAMTPTGGNLKYIYIVNGDNASYVASGVILSSAMSYYTFTFTAKHKTLTEGTMNAPWIRIYNTDSTKPSKIYVDDISLAKQPVQLTLSSSIPSNGGNMEASDFITVKFNNAMNESNVTNISNYSLNSSDITVSEITKNADGSYCIHFNKTLKELTDYTLNMTGLKDVYGQALNTSLSFSVSGSNKLYYDDIKIFKDYGLYTQRDITDTVLESGNISAVVGNVYNNSDKQYNLMVAIALYKDNNLLELATDTATVEVGQTLSLPLNASISVPAERENGYTLKTFFWDKDSLSPFISSKTLSDYQVVNYIVKPDGTGDFTSPKLANDVITDSSVNKRYLITVYPGEYTEINWTVKPYTTIRGTDMSTCIIKGELPDETAATSEGRAMITNKSTINLVDSCNLENLTINARNLRYPVHSEAGGLNKNAVHDVKNCYIEHFGNAGATNYYINNGYGTNKYDVWQWTTAWGYGSASGVLETFENTTFKSVDRAWYVHGNENFSDPQINVLNNCHMTSGIMQDITVESLGSTTEDTVVLNGCTFDGLFIYADDSPWIPTNQSSQYADHSDYNIILNNCQPIGYKDGHRGKGLGIFSNSTSSGSAVAVSGTAVSCLLDKYVSKSGGGGLKGYLYGNLDISGIMVGTGSNVQVNNTLGRRLGDCSVNNKSLTIVYDGDSSKTVSILFNQDYTNMTNSQVLSIINQSISSYGSAQEYNITLNECYPKFTDKELKLTNTSSVGIPRFSAVCYDISTNSIRCMTENDNPNAFVGITLERILPGSSGRVLTEGYMNNIQLGVSSIASGANITVSGNLGGFAISGSGPVVLTCSNNYGWAYFKGNR